MPTQKVIYEGQELTVSYTGEFDPVAAKAKLDAHFGKVAEAKPVEREDRVSSKGLTDIITGEKADSLPSPERGRVQQLHGLTDEETASIEAEFLAGYESQENTSPSKADRFKANFRQSFYSNTVAGMAAKNKETGQGTANRIAMSEKRINNLLQELEIRKNDGFSQYPELTEDVIVDRINREQQQIDSLQPQRREELIEGLQKQARRAGEYAGMPEWDGVLEGMTALAGQLAGSSATPETFTPAGKGGNLLKTIGRQAASGALTNAATNPVIQSGNVASGDQSEFSKSQLALDTTLGAVAPVVMKSPAALVKFVRSRGANDVVAQATAEGVRAQQLQSEPSVIAKAGEKVLNAKNSVGRGVNSVIQPISTRLDNIVPGLGGSIRYHAFEVGTGQAQGHQIAKPFLQQYSKLPKGVKSELDLAFKNQDGQTISKILDQYHMMDNYRSVRTMLDDLHSKASDSGFEVGYLKDYMPRRIKDYEGLLNELRGDKDWGAIQDAMRRRAKEMGIDHIDAESAQVRGEVINQVLRDMKGTGINTGPASNLKQRRIKQLDKRLNKYYHDTPTALLQYIDNVSRLMADRRFFGLGSDDAFNDISVAPQALNGNWRNKDIGSTIARMIDEGKLDPSKETEVKNILDAYFNMGSMHGGLKWYKNFTYATTLGSPISSLTQVADLFPSMYRNGLFNTVMGIKDAAISSKRITREDIGIENIAAEFANFGTMAKTVDKILTVSQFSRIDRLGKETFINSAFRKLQKQARAPKGSKTYKKIYAALKPALKEDTEAAIEAFARGDKQNAHVRFALFDQLSDFQPLTRAEMPEKYLSNPNGRLFYTLKTFTIRQFDALRRESFAEMRKGNVVKGLKNLTHLALFWATMGTTVDAMKDLVLGREFDPGDLAMENALKVFGVTRWSIYQAQEHGPMEALLRTARPPVKFFEDIWKDAKSMTQGEFELKYAETIQDMPWVGKLYYWNFGAGAEKEAKKRGKSASL